MPAGARPPMLHELVTRDFVGLEREIEAALGGGRELLACRSCAAAPRCSTSPARPPTPLRRACYELLRRDVAERVIFDLGLVRSLGYYTGAIFEVYDAALGVPLGGGGRYDELLGRFGRALPAVGWALDVERCTLARRGRGAMSGR